VPQVAPLQPVPESVHVTAVLVEPVTVAANCLVVLTCTLADVGATVTATAGTGLTVTVAVAVLVLSAAEVALTVTVSAAVTVAGGVYTPVLETDPQAAALQEAVQVAEVLLEPVTVAVNVGRLAVAPAVTVAVAGETVMATEAVLFELLVEVDEPPPQAVNMDKRIVSTANPHPRVRSCTLVLRGQILSDACARMAGAGSLS